MRKTSLVCDRCGGEKVKGFSVNFDTPNGVLRDIAWVTLRAGSGFQRDLDLCENCMKDLVDWFARKNCSG